MPDTIGKYQIIERIGRGGMGTIFKARDPVLDRLVAVKVISTDIDVTDELRARFFREAQTAARLGHPNIVTVHDMGEDAGRLYIVMELLDGEELRALIARRAPLSLEERLGIALDVCDGLHHAHQHGVVHRDIKPANIMRVTNGRVKILDFGIARVAAADAGLTRTGLVMGTLRYIAPEQLEGRSDHRADIFSFGAVLYELLSGRPCFDAVDVMQLLEQLRTAEPRPLSDLDLGLPPGLGPIVERALRKDPSERFADLSEMREALADVLRDAREDARRARERVDARRGELTRLERALAERLGAPAPASASPRTEPVALADLRRLEDDLGAQASELRARAARVEGLEPALARGIELIEAGRFTDAEAALSPIVDAMPEHARARAALERAAAGLADARRHDETRRAIDEARAALAEGRQGAGLDALERAERMSGSTELTATIAALRDTARAARDTERVTEPDTTVPHEVVPPEPTIARGALDSTSAHGVDVAPPRPGRLRARTVLAACACIAVAALGAMVATRWSARETSKPAAGPGAVATAPPAATTPMVGSSPGPPAGVETVAPPGSSPVEPLAAAPSVGAAQSASPPAATTRAPAGSAQTGPVDGRASVAAEDEAAAARRAMADAERARAAAGEARAAAERADAPRFAAPSFSSAQAREAQGESALRRQDAATAASRFREARRGYADAAKAAGAAADQERIAAQLRKQADAEQQQRVAALQQRKQAEAEQAAAARRAAEQAAAQEAEKQASADRAKADRSRRAAGAARDQAAKSDAEHLAKETFDSARSRYAAAESLLGRQEYVAAGKAYDDAAGRYAEAGRRAKASQEARAGADEARARMLKEKQRARPAASEFDQASAQERQGAQLYDSAAFKEAGDRFASAADLYAKAAPRADDRPEVADVRRVLAAYARAFDARDIAQVQKIRPGLAGDELKRMQHSFEQSRDYRLTLRVDSVDVTGDDAVAKGRREDVVTSKSGQAYRNTASFAFRLKRTAAGWIIDGPAN